MSTNEMFYKQEGEKEGRRGRRWAVVCTVYVHTHKQEGQKEGRRGKRLAVVCTVYVHCMYTMPRATS